MSFQSSLSFVCFCACTGSGGGLVESRWPVHKPCRADLRVCVCVCMCACVSFSIPALHNAPVCSPLYWSGFGIPGAQAGAQAASLSALCKTSEPWT